MALYGTMGRAPMRRRQYQPGGSGVGHNQSGQFMVVEVITVTGTASYLPGIHGPLGVLQFHAVAPHHAHEEPDALILEVGAQPPGSSEKPDNSLRNMSS